jgi:hypothetical protein
MPLHEQLAGQLERRARLTESANDFRPLLVEIGPPNVRTWLNIHVSSLDHGDNNV